MTAFQLKPPLYISSRLMAAVDLAPLGSTIATFHVQGDPSLWHYVIEALEEGAEDMTELAEGMDLRGPQHPRAALETLLSFLEAAAESYDHRLRTGRPGENEDLFPPACVEWAHQHSDEISMLRSELDEGDET